MNVFTQPPEKENGRFLLRFVREEDCRDLWKVYSDPLSVPFFNGDNCNGDDFHYTTPERMLEALRFWRWACTQGYFVRWSIVDKNAREAVGTVELCLRVSGDCYNGCAILRLDLRSDYETESSIGEILPLILPDVFRWFGCKAVITKAKPIAAQRVRTLTKFGFVPSPDPLIGSDGVSYPDYYLLTQA